jgi:hypothetical protein
MGSSRLFTRHVRAPPRMPQTVRTEATATETKVEPRRMDDRTREANDRPNNLHDHVLRHQRTVGNRAVQRLIESPAPTLFFKPSSARRNTHNEEREPDEAPAVAQPANHTDTAAQVVPLPPRAQVTKSAGAPSIQRAWYNFDIPFTASKASTRPRVSSRTPPSRRSIGSSTRSAIWCRPEWTGSPRSGTR